jgi:hypothetical protein
MERVLEAGLSRGAPRRRPHAARPPRAGPRRARPSPAAGSPAARTISRYSRHSHAAASPGTAGAPPRAWPSSPPPQPPPPSMELMRLPGTSGSRCRASARHGALPRGCRGLSQAVADRRAEGGREGAARGFRGFKDLIERVNISRAGGRGRGGKRGALAPQAGGRGAAGYWTGCKAPRHHFQTRPTPRAPPDWMAAAGIGPRGRAGVPRARQRDGVPPRSHVRASSAGGRHPEQAAVAGTPAAVRAPQERPDVEQDPRYARCGGRGGGGRGRGNACAQGRALSLPEHGGARASRWAPGGRAAGRARACRARRLPLHRPTPPPPRPAPPHAAPPGSTFRSSSRSRRAPHLRATSRAARQA